MTEFLAGVLAGIAAHQTDRIFVDWPVHWEYITRYIVGVLAGMLVFVLMLSRLNRGALRDGMLSIAGAFGSVGLGVAVGRLYDEATK